MNHHQFFIGSGISAPEAIAATTTKKKAEDTLPSLHKLERFMADVLKRVHGGSNMIPTVSEDVLTDDGVLDPEIEIDCGPPTPIPTLDDGGEFSLYLEGEGIDASIKSERPQNLHDKFRAALRRILDVFNESQNRLQSEKQGADPDSFDLVLEIVPEEGSESHLNVTPGKKPLPRVSAPTIETPALSNEARILALEERLKIVEKIGAISMRLFTLLSTRDAEIAELHAEIILADFAAVPKKASNENTQKPISQKEANAAAQELLDKLKGERTKPLG